MELLSTGEEVILPNMDALHTADQTLYESLTQITPKIEEKITEELAPIIPSLINADYSAIEDFFLMWERNKSWLSLKKRGRDHNQWLTF